MILNNLDKAVAQFPQELVTYGGNGQVFSNWAQVSKLLILDHFYPLDKFIPIRFCSSKNVFSLNIVLDCIELPSNYGK